jgi:type IV fimbrial biogenesis protein FimT
MPARSCRPSARGTTLVELATVLGVIGLLITFAGPSFVDWIGAQRQLGHAQHVAWSLNFARGEAVKSGHRVSLCKSTDRMTCIEDASWDGGFLVWVDANRNALVDAGERVLRVDGPAPSGVTIRANRPLDDYVSYTSLGQARLLNGALQMGTLSVCSPGRAAIRVVLASSGRARIERADAPCA